MVNAISFYRVGRWFTLKRMPLISKFIELVIFLVYNSRIPVKAEIGKGSYFAYSGIGCVIHSRVILGENVCIGTNVTIGGRAEHKDVPKIGNNVYIATGAKILGPIIIGDNVTIGANAVVIKNVPNNAVVAGVPAKIIKYKEL